MAIYHCSIKIISRGKGKSAVAAAAYRAGETIMNEYDGIAHDYTRKGGIVHTEVLLPENAPAEYADRATLWNAVEKIEKAKNSQLAREIEIALPVELTQEQRISLAREYVNRNFVSAGMCADFAIHDTGGGNPHAHIMLTMRPFTEEKAWGAKQKKEYMLDEGGNKIYDPKKRQYKCKSIPATDWNEQSKAEEWRSTWADICNRTLEQNGHAERIDHRSYERQGINQIPSIHLGAAASQMEKRGIRSERGNINREIEISNQKLRQLKARIVKLQKWMEEETDNTEPPTLADVITNILSRREQTGRRSSYNAIHNLKAAANMLNFLTANGIKDMAGLGEKLQSMIEKQFSIRAESKTIDRRLKVLDEHIEQAEYYLEFKPLNQQRRQMKPKHQDNYTEAHRREFTLFEAAERYLNGVMNGRTSLPLKAWKAERDKLNVDRRRLNVEYVLLKNDTGEVEKIRSNVYDIMREEQCREQPKGAHDMEL